MKGKCYDAPELYNYRLLWDIKAFVTKLRIRFYVKIKLNQLKSNNSFNFTLYL